MFAADELDAMRRDFILNPDLDGEVRSRIMFVAAVLEATARDTGDQNADQLYVITCWHLSQPENRAELDRVYRQVYAEGMAMLAELEEGN